MGKKSTGEPGAKVSRNTSVSLERAIELVGEERLFHGVGNRGSNWRESHSVPAGHVLDIYVALVKESRLAVRPRPRVLVNVLAHVEAAYDSSAWPRVVTALELVLEKDVTEEWKAG